MVKRRMQLFQCGEDGAAPCIADGCLSSAESARVQRERIEAVNARNAALEQSRLHATGRLNADGRERADRVAH